MSAPALLEVRQLGRRFDLPRSTPWARPEGLQALADVSLRLEAGRSLGVVGESGSGKSTLARLVMALDRPSAGQVLFKGQDIHALSAAPLRALRADFQMVFQDPQASLNPRMSVHDIVTEPLVIHRQLMGLNARQRTERALELLQLVGLQPAIAVLAIAIPYGLYHTVPPGWVSTVTCGAALWHSTQPTQVVCERARQRRYWHHDVQKN